MAASLSKINPSKLPPTERAVWFHSLRMYLQIWEWKALKHGPLLEVTDWGWKFENGEAVPIMTDQVISFHYSRIGEPLYSFYSTGIFVSLLL